MDDATTPEHPHGTTPRVAATVTTAEVVRPVGTDVSIVEQEALSIVEMARLDRAPLHIRFTAADGRDVALGTEPRPSWRGRLHLMALIVAVPATIVLLSAAESARARIGTAIYAAGLCAMFLTSTTYHRWVHDLRARFRWRRADHAMIFAAIAGTATPVLLVMMPGGLGIALLAVFGSMSIVGAVCKLSRWRRGDVIGSVLYGVVGWLGLLALPSLWRNGGVLAAALWLGGGVLYSLGGFAFAKEWPRVRSTVFGYHEVWHLFTIAAAAAQFATIWMIAT